MQLDITKEAQQRLNHLCGQAPAKLLLDFDDGVGSLSKFGACSMDGSYRLLLIDPHSGGEDYSAVINSNLGPLYYLPADKTQFDSNMQLRYDPRFLTLKLVSPNHILSNNVEVVDLRNVEVNQTIRGQQGEC